MQQIKHNKNTAKIWVESLGQVEDNTLEQIKQMLDLPVIFSHIAIMPDTHLGMGAVVGAVVATEGAIVPNIVGVDIGCGMSAFNTGIKWDRDLLGKEFWLDYKTRAYRSIPTGFSSHSLAQPMEGLMEPLKAKPILELQRSKAPLQIGTMGGGNHFLEAQVDETGNIWFMVHSGSRYTGLKIAEYYNQRAHELDEELGLGAPENLWFLPLDHQLGQDYLADMSWAVNFALENRWRMLEQAISCFNNSLEKFDLKDGVELSQVRRQGINIHHNFANIEEHFGKRVVVHRKGATQAQKDQLGIIPGSMGASSYIVKGLGNPDSFMSSSHGAGRKMSRSVARKTINENDLYQSLKNTFTKPSSKIIDEAPGAYKDIDQVMDNQKDLVEVVHKLYPIITIKGEGG